jgi:hypothetical protein
MNKPFDFLASAILGLCLFLAFLFVSEFSRRPAPVAPVNIPAPAPVEPCKPCKPQPPHRCPTPAPFPSRPFTIRCPYCRNAVNVGPPDGTGEVKEVTK